MNLRRYNSKPTPKHIHSGMITPKTLKWLPLRKTIVSRIWSSKPKKGTVDLRFHPSMRTRLGKGWGQGPRNTSEPILRPIPTHSCCISIIKYLWITDVSPYLPSYLRKEVEGVKEPYCPPTDNPGNDRWRKISIHERWGRRTTVKVDGRLWC